MMKWDLVIPSKAFGLRLNAFIREDLKRPDVDLYKINPLSPRMFTNAFPVLLCSLIRSDTVSRWFMLLKLARQLVVLGMLHSFFLVDHRAFHFLLAKLYRTGTFS
jgi:hypothetical protein